MTEISARKNRNRNGNRRRHKGIATSTTTTTTLSPLNSTEIMEDEYMNMTTEYPEGRVIWWSGIIRRNCGVCLPM